MIADCALLVKRTQRSASYAV